MSTSTESEILHDPAASHWLKDQIKETAERDVVDALRDAEILVAVLDARYSKAVIHD